MSVSFADVVGTIPCSAAARERAAKVPIPACSDSLLPAALWWGEHVAGVFPLIPANEGSGSDAGKLPLLPGKSDDPSRRLRSGEEIATVWNAQPLCNIGLTTVGQSILVIDIDPRHGGIRSMVEWVEHLGVDLADVPRQESPRGDGGVHLFWRLPDGAPRPKMGSPLDGVDIPWQVPVAPSIRRVQVGEDYQGAPVYDYRPYRWIAGDPRELPTVPEPLLAGLAQLGRIKGVRPSRTVKKERDRYDPIPLVVAELKKTGIPHGRQNITVRDLATSMARRKVPMEDAIGTILEILAVSQQGLNRGERRWTRADLYGTGTPGSVDWRPGLVYRQYEFIADDRRQEEEQHAAWATSLRASFRRTRTRS